MSETLDFETIRQNIRFRCLIPEVKVVDVDLWMQKVVKEGKEKHPHLAGYKLRDGRVVEVTFRFEG